MFRWSVAFLVALLPVVILRDFTPSNELRYLSIANEALSSHRLFAFMYDGVPYADKPPLYIWIVMLCRTLGFGNYYMWMLSIFSVLPFFVSAYVMYCWTRDYLGEKMRLTSALILATCGYWLFLGVTIRMDMLMCMFILLALWTWWRNYSESDCRAPRWHWLFAFYTFMALFTKGPVGVLVPVVSVMVFSLAERKPSLIPRSLGWRFWLLLLGGCFLWWGVAWLEGGDEYIYNLLYKQTVNRAVNANVHRQPFYYYCYTIWYTFAPWMPWLAVLLWRGFRGGEWGKTPLVRYFLLTSLATFVMLSLFSSKLEVYLLPIAPLLVYAAMLWKCELSDRAHRVVRWIVGVFLCVAFVVGCALPWINPMIGYRDLAKNLRLLSNQYETEGYVACGLERFPAIDVFLHSPSPNLLVEELMVGGYDNHLLVTNEVGLKRNAMLVSFTADKQRVDVGEYVVFVLKSNKEQKNE